MVVTYTIDATTSHPFYVAEYGFKPAGELKTGDTLLLLDGTSKEILYIESEHLKESVKMYNFEVKEWHTYFYCRIGGAGA